MIGAIAGDIVGSLFEFNPIKTKDFQLFHDLSKYTDDTVLTMAVAAAILDDSDYGAKIQDFARRYPGRGYGGMFAEWIHAENPEPYNSYGNGSAMRVSALGFAFDSVEKVLEEAKKSAECTHNHPEGIKGAQATALAILMARTGSSKDDIKKEIMDRFEYDLDRKLETIWQYYTFDVTCQGSVPEAIICFLEADSFENTIRNAVSLGGDADTQACIAGGIAEAFYGVPEDIVADTRKRLPDEFLKIIDGLM